MLRPIAGFTRWSVSSRGLPSWRKSTMVSFQTEGGSRTLATTDVNATQRISLALYRQLLRWCNGTDDDVPLSYYIPPIYLEPPKVDKQNLELLVKGGDEDSRVTASMFPPKSIIEEDQITCPINTPEDARSFFRAIFRVNSRLPNPDVQKQRISLAFEGLRSLNELTIALVELKKNREKHANRSGVNFRVGQVVKHKTEEWRGVIVGWVRIDVDKESDKPEQATSLTQKTYQLDPEDTVKYTVLLDTGDAHLLYAKRREVGHLNIAETHQSDLAPVEDDTLLRIRSSHSEQHFKRFDAESKSFLANEILGYEYPSDVSKATPTLATDSASDIAPTVTAGTQKVASCIRRVIMNYTSAPESRKLKLLSFFWDRLTSISNGDVIPLQDRFATGDVPKQRVAALHLQELVNVTVDMGELLWQKRRSEECERTLQFQVGDVVRHKIYGFRGVVVAWDAKAAVDVSRWDGLQNIKNPEQYPFYHVIPDQNDCTQAFGGERPSRYVCEANLEACPKDSLDVDIDLEPEWEFDRSNSVFVPPDEVKFKYGMGLDDDGVTEQCLVEMKDALSRFLVAGRDGIQTGDEELDLAAQQLNSDNLFAILKTADDMQTATMISESLKEIWKAHVDQNLRWELDTAIAHLLSGNTELALEGFGKVIDQDPSYAEAWNKASTCEFMLGNMDASLAAASKALEYLPRHFQALNGLGLVYYEKKDLPAAVEIFRKSMMLDPWSPVSARLSTCIDTLKSWERKNKIEES